MYLCMYYRSFSKVCSLLPFWYQSDSSLGTVECECLVVEIRVFQVGISLIAGTTKSMVNNL